jgi:hypothetical protein
MPVNAQSRHNRNNHDQLTAACHALGLGQQLCSRIRHSLGACYCGTLHVVCSTTGWRQLKGGWLAPSVLSLHTSQAGLSASCACSMQRRYGKETDGCTLLLLVVQVTCGSTIKLVHSSSGARLHSHGVAYSRGSQQQSVTGYPDSENSQSYWIVHGAVVSQGPCVSLPV